MSNASLRLDALRLPSMTRALGVLLITGFSALPLAAQAAFGFEQVAARAQELAQRDYAAPSNDLPKEL